MLKRIFTKIFTKKVLLFLGIVFVICIGLALFFDQIVMPWYTEHGQALAVPNVIAKRFDTAKELLELQGLEVVKQGEKYDSQLPFGYVVEQNPRANRLVKKGRRIYLTLSIGERELLLPDLKGLSETNAEETLKSLGLRIGEREYKYVPNELPLVVIEQSIPPNSYVKTSTLVDITVSLGEPVENVIVPSLIGISFENAKRSIQKAGLTLGHVTYLRNEDLLPNTVIDQTLNAGTTAASGDTLHLVVSQ
ncbi:MAG: PASTA domain-containing protein [bacterium]